MKQACSLALRNIYNFSYKPSIQFIYAARKLNPDRIIPSNMNLEVKQVPIEKQEQIKAKPEQNQETIEVIPNQCIQSIIEQYKIPLSQSEIDIINLCGPLVGFEQPKKDIDKTKKKK